jgi:hypothetical protein
MNGRGRSSLRLKKSATDPRDGAARAPILVRTPGDGSRPAVDARVPAAAMLVRRRAEVSRPQGRWRHEPVADGPSVDLVVGAEAEYGATTAAGRWSPATT